MKLKHAIEALKTKMLTYEHNLECGLWVICDAIQKELSEIKAELTYLEQQGEGEIDINELINDLTNMAQLMFGIKAEWETVGSWSEWDQEQIDNNHKWLKRLYPLSSLPQPTPDQPKAEEVKQPDEIYSFVSNPLNTMSIDNWKQPASVLTDHILTREQSLKAEIERLKKGLEIRKAGAYGELESENQSLKERVKEIQASMDAEKFACAVVCEPTIESLRTRITQLEAEKKEAIEQAFKTGASAMFFNVFIGHPGEKSELLYSQTELDKVKAEYLASQSQTPNS